MNQVNIKHTVIWICVADMQTTLVVLVWVWGAVWGQGAPESPCPGVFQYEQDSTGTWHGVITVPNPLPFVAIDLTVSIYITSNVPSVSRTRSTYCCVVYTSNEH